MGLAEQKRRKRKEGGKLNINRRWYKDVANMLDGMNGPQKETENRDAHFRTGWIFGVGS